MEKIYWLDNCNWEFQWGIFLRNIQIHNFIEKIEESWKEVVGIKIDLEWKNLEFITRWDLFDK